MKDDRYDFDVIIESAGRKAVREVLAQCTKEEQVGFRRIFSHWGQTVDDIPEDRLRDAYDLCKRTLAANEEG